jgi:histidine ammonia-lyase
VTALRSAGVPGPGPDRHLAPELEDAKKLIVTGKVVRAVEGAIGELR